MAGFGDLSYEPIELGGQPALRFTGGKQPFSLVGPEAVRLKSAIDRAKSAGPQPIAMNGNQIVAGAISGATGTGGVGPVDLRGTGGAQNLEQAAPTPPAATGGASGSWETAPDADPLPAGAGEGSSEEKPGKPYTRLSNDLVRDNRTRAILTYRAPVAASPGGWQGSSRQTQVTGAHPLDPEIMAGMEKAYTEQIDQAHKLRALNKQAAAETTAATRAELERQGAQKAEQERYVAEQRALVQKAEDRRQAAEADYSASRVDPNRMFAGDTGTLRAIGAALAQAAGAFGAALSGTPNFAAQIVQAAIDRDVQAQRDEIRVKGDTADNALRDLMARGMKLDEATNALRGMQTQYAAQQLAAVKTAYGADEAAIAGDANMTALTQQYLQWKSDYTRAAEGEATIAMSERYRAPTAGRAGGMALATPEQIKASAEAGTAFNKWQASGDAKAPQNVQERRIAGAIGELTSNYDMIKDMPADEVLPTTENQGVLTRGYRAAENFIGGAGTATRNLDKATQKQVEMVNQVRQSLLANLSVAREQGVIRESEYGRAAEEITGAGTWGALQDISKRQINSFQARREAVRGAPSVGETLTQEQ